MPAKLLSKVGTVIAKLALSVMLFVFGAGIVKQVALAFGSTYVSSGLVYAMMVSLILPIWFRAPIPWKIAAGSAAFMAGILTYTAGRSLSAGVLAGFSVIVSLVVVILVLRLGRKRSADPSSP